MSSEQKAKRKEQVKVKREQSGNGKELRAKGKEEMHYPNSLF